MRGAWWMLAVILGLAAGLAVLARVAVGQGSGGEASDEQGEQDERDALAAEVRRLQDELAEASADCAEELNALRVRLETVQLARAEREYAWFEYNQALAQLKIDHKVPPFSVDPDYLPKTVELPESTAEEELASELARRAREIQVSLRHFLLVEEIRGIDMLEIGSLDRGTVGPVVFRLLDDRGRLAGGLTAERLRLEASRAGHTVTLVLENGFESRGGNRVPFEGGVRRIVLPYVDPQPWIDSMPELFPLGKVRPPLDDARWNRSRVQRELNTLLRQAAGEGGHYRLSRVEGVLGTELQLVQLESYDENGGLERRLFADRMTIASEGKAVRITLTDGIIVRAGSRTPFIDGTLRLYLPGADVPAWEAARIPGIVDAPGPD